MLSVYIRQHELLIFLTYQWSSADMGKFYFVLPYSVLKNIPLYKSVMMLIQIYLSIMNVYFLSLSYFNIAIVLCSSSRSAITK